MPKHVSRPFVVMVGILALTAVVLQVEHGWVPRDFWEAAVLAVVGHQVLVVLEKIRQGGEADAE